MNVKQLRHALKGARDDLIVAVRVEGAADRRLEGVDVDGGRDPRRVVLIAEHQADAERRKDSRPMSDCEEVAREDARRSGPTYVTGQTTGDFAARNREAGRALLRIAAELRAILPVDETASVFDDLAEQERIGHWLVSSVAIDGTALGSTVTGPPAS